MQKLLQQKREWIQKLVK
jgi:ATPase-IIC_X-K: Na,H/K antiporter P-type ATPase, alpha subunit